MIYLDNSATTKQYDQVSDLIYETAKSDFANPSSAYTLGTSAHNKLQTARASIEKYFFGSGNLIFTSSGTESDNMALLSSAIKLRRAGKRIVTSAIEHPAVLETCKRLADMGFDIKYIPVDVDGYIEEQAVKAALSDEVIIVSVMTVNNEVGTIEPVSQIYKSVYEYNKQHGTRIVFHTDAVQAFGKLSLEDAPFDLISVSAHKIHGPKGQGALYMNKSLKLPPFITGGGQEMGYRSSTENLPSILGFAKAAELSFNNLSTKMRNIASINEYLRRGIMQEIKDCVLNGPEELGYGLLDYGKRIPNILNISFLGTRAEVILHTLEQDGIYVSTGSACSSHNNTDSHVLKAMSMNHSEIESAIRFSFDEFNTMEEMDIVIDKLKKSINRFRSLGSLR